MQDLCRAQRYSNDIGAFASPKDFKKKNGTA